MKNTKKTSRKMKGHTISRSPFELGNSRSYKDQALASFKVRGNASLLSTTITTGVIANSYVVTNSNIQNFSSRFANSWDEYRIIKAHFAIRPVSPTASGITAFFFDEKLNSSPVLLDSQERNVKLLPNSSNNSKSVYELEWSARDVADLVWTATTANLNPVWFKTYTDGANWGSPVVVTPLWIIQPTFTLQFRGLKAS